MSRPVVPFPGRILIVVDPTSEHLTASLGTEVSPVPKAPKPRRASEPQTPPTPAREPRELTEQEEDLQRRMFKAYFENRRPSRNHAQTSIANDRRAVEDLLAFIGQPLWQLTENDFEVWSAHLGVTRKLAPNSQRRMQGAVCTFMRYLVHHQAFQNQALRLGGRLQEIGHSENRIVHSTDNNHVRVRKYLTSAEFQDLLRIQDAAIEIAVRKAPRRARALMRDKAMFLTYYTYGLRLTEGHGMNVDSFRPNPTLPELGQFGFAHVYGKGSNGSGPRFRAVPAILPDIRAVMEWYLAVVRPLYGVCDDEPALWLSEQGRRLGRSAIDVRFKILVEIAGYDRADISVHGLRHMSVSHEAEAGVSLHFTQQRHGHAHASTTQQYTHLPEEFIRNAARKLVDDLVKRKET